MKKTILSLAVALLGLAGSSYAATPKMDVPVTVEQQFTQQFADAMNVRWEKEKDFFKATFEDRGRTQSAFYYDKGGLIGVSSSISSAALPERLRTSIKDFWSGYWITDLVSFHNANRKGFAVTLENADRVVELSAVGHGEWMVYKTISKN
jgi:hypothetical protein